MIDRTQLTEALARWDQTHPLTEDQFNGIVEAARLLLDFPTDEMVEAAVERSMWSSRDVRAVLEAVRRVMIGGDDA